MNDIGRDWLADLEGGCRIKAYRDSAGIPTIGVGQTFWLTSGTRRRVEMGDTLPSKSAGLAMFARALKDYEAAVDAAVRDDITQDEMNAFTSLCYNIGQRAFTGSTAVKLFNQKAPLIQVAKAVELWNRAGGRIDQGLIERRECETDLLLTGLYRVQGQKRPV
jgi:lysozyme